MIVHNGFNRRIIKEYLDLVLEDDLIDDVIVPIFIENNYQVFRKNIHGPGEHGKDIIFSRYVKLFRDNEYVAVQAKAEKGNTKNSSSFASQINRAHKVPILGKANASIYPNYVFFINSRMHTTDAHIEMHYLPDVKVNTKIISQDQLIDMMLEFNIIPTLLDSKVEKYQNDQNASYDDIVRSIILSDDNKKINKLLDYDLRIDTRNLSDHVKGLIVNYIFKKWEDDGSWAGTVKPMEWLNYYFSYIQPEQYKKLFKVFQEFLSSYPSREAKTDTFQVLSKITPAQINEFKDQFIKILVEQVYSKPKTSDYEILIKKLKELQAAKYLNNIYLSIGKKAQRAIKLRSLIPNANEEEKAVLKEEYKEVNSDLYDFLYPDDKD